MTEDEMVGWHHHLNGHEFEQPPGVGDGQGDLVCSSPLLENILMMAKSEGRKRRGTNNEIIGQHHCLNGHEFKQTLGDSEGQGRLVCCNPWGCKELDMT